MTWKPNPYTFNCPVCSARIECDIMLMPLTSQLVLDVNPIKAHFQVHVDVVSETWSLLEHVVTQVADRITAPLPETPRVYQEWETCEDKLRCSIHDGHRRHEVLGGMSTIEGRVRRDGPA